MKAHIAKKMKEWVESHAKHHTAQVQRVAKRFALVAVAGELATEYDVLPWAVGEASQFASLCFKSFVDGFETTEDRQLRLCKGVLDFAVAYPNNFEYVTPPDVTVYQAVNPNPFFGSIVYGLPINGSNRGEPAALVLTSEGMKRACAGNQSEGIKEQYKSRTPLNIGGIAVLSGYVVIPEWAYPDNVREALKNTKFAEKKTHKVGTGQKK